MKKISYTFTTSGRTAQITIVKQEDGNIFIDADIELTQEESDELVENITF